MLQDMAAWKQRYVKDWVNEDNNCVSDNNKLVIDTAGAELDENPLDMNPVPGPSGELH